MDKNNIVVDNRKYLVQKKTHKNKIINWIYAKKHGYEVVYYIPDGEAYYYDNVAHVNPNTYKQILSRELGDKWWH